MKRFTRVEGECYPDHTFAGEKRRERHDDNKTVIEAPNYPNIAGNSMVLSPDESFHMGNHTKDVATIREWASQGVVGNQCIFLYLFQFHSFRQKIH